MIDINEGGTSVLSTKLTIDNTEKTSTSAVTPAVISDSALADDAEITDDTVAGESEKPEPLELVEYEEALADYVHRADFGPRDGSDLDAWIRTILAANGFADIADGDVILQGHPRVLGYVFNPVSFWFCLDGAGRLRAVLAEVNNTFGERHLYLVAHDDKRPIAPEDWLTSSPFLPVEGGYRFRFRLEAGRVRADIHYYDAQQGDAAKPMLVTYVDGERRDLSGPAVLRTLLRHPLMTLAVIALIHYQAIKIWAKRGRFHRKPEPPQETLTR